MTVLDAFVLPPDVLIVPVAELPAEVRAGLECGDGDFALTRPRSRMMSTIVDPRTAALLEAFRAPATIVDAVIAFSRSAGEDPRETLEAAVATLGGFVGDGLLVPPDSELARPIETSFAPGEEVAGFHIVEAVHLIVDTEVYLARAATGEHAALKVARPGAAARLRRPFADEAAVLDLLDGRGSPRLLRRGEVDGRPFLAMAWCSGADAFEAAAEARALGGRPGRVALLALVERVAEAYTALHGRGVLHGDVHPRNVLVDGGGAVTIIDFGLAATTEAQNAARGGVDFFMEPELARTRLAGTPSTPLTAAGEQYSIAALLYLLLTGGHTHAFGLEPELMLRQLTGDPPLPFARHGVADLPTVERAIGRALAKTPGARHGSMSAFLRALGSAILCDLAPAPTPPPPRAPGAAGELLSVVLARLADTDADADADGHRDGAPRALPTPTASAFNGGAGAAYALLRIAGVRGDESLLARADLFSSRAVAAVEAGDERAFWDAEIEIVPEVFGEQSLYHAANGVHLVHGLVAAARADEWSAGRALDAFLAGAGEPCRQADVCFGRAGLLIGCGLLHEALPPAIDRRALRALGDGLSSGLAAELSGESTALRWLGAAHGWAGILFALLRWSEASGGAWPAGVDDRLRRLASLGEPVGRGMRWPHTAGDPAAANVLAATWCNGAAGMVALWTLADRLTGDEAFARLAHAAAWTAYTDPADSGDLCCGLGGRAYALLNLYRHTDDAAWLERARELARRAALSVRAAALPRRDSLYKGELGVALLAADLEDPRHACLPLFEGEGWPAPRA